jgi:pilus assembly protein CpaF
VFGKRSDGETAPARKAPPPAPAGAPIATRPQPAAAASPPLEAPAPKSSAPTASAPAAGRPQKTPQALDQLRAAQGPTAQIVREQSDYYHATKTTIFNALLNTIDLSQLAQLDQKSAAEEIKDIVAELVAIKNVQMSVSETEHLVQDIINDVLGYGPLEPLLARDDIADVMVNGANRVFIEVGGKVQLTNVRFRDNAQLMNICQRIVSQVGRRVDESSPICDARLPDEIGRASCRERVS